MNTAKAHVGPVMTRVMDGVGTRVGNEGAVSSGGLRCSASASELGMRGSTPTLSEALATFRQDGRPSSVTSKPTVVLQGHRDLRNEVDLQRYADMIKAGQQKSDFLLNYTPEDDFAVRRELYRLTNKVAVSTGVSAPTLLETTVSTLLGPLKAGMFVVGAVKGTSKTVTTLAQVKEKIERYTERYVAKYEKAIKKIIDDSTITPEERRKLVEWHLEHQYNLSEHFHEHGPLYKGKAAAQVEEKLHHALGKVWEQKK